MYMYMYMIMCYIYIYIYIHIYTQLRSGARLSRLSPREVGAPVLNSCNNKFNHIVSTYNCNQITISQLNIQH